MTQPATSNYGSTTANRNLAPAAVGQGPGVTNYQAPQPVEVYHLPDAVNNGIPPDIRSQFQCDDFGRLLFFTTPPVDVRPTEKEGAGLAHSAKYLAAMQRRNEERQRKRKRDEEEDEPEQQKRERAQHRRAEFDEKTKALKARAEEVWRKQMKVAAEREMAGLVQFKSATGAMSTPRPAVTDVEMVNGHS